MGCLAEGAVSALGITTGICNADDSIAVAEEADENNGPYKFKFEQKWHSAESSDKW